MQPNDIASENSSKEHLDSVTISDEAVRQQNENTALDKTLETLVKHFMRQFSNLESIEKQKTESPFKMELRASSIFGRENLIQDYLEGQYEVFHKWLEENADDLSEENRSRLFAEIKTLRMQWTG